ncbi:MAG: ABC transporter ATP-binding protein [Myxococcaceae bacterium]
MIQVQGLTKYYGEHAAIRDLSFDIEKGSVFGFLGLNGAGKSTTLKVLGCVLLPTSGKVVIDGFDVATQPHEIRKRIGYLPDTPPVYDEMTVGGYLDFVARLRGVPGDKVDGFVKEAEQKTAITHMHEMPISALSHGYRQRVGLAQALVHKPKLLILDEPTSGLDPVQIVEMRNVIRSLKGEHTVLLSSHILYEISQICDRLLVIQSGEIVAQGSEADLASKFGTGAGAIELEVAGDPQKAIDALKAVTGVASVQLTQRDSDKSALRVDGSPALRPQLVRALVAANVDLLKLGEASGRLENIFMKLTVKPEAKA